MVNGLTANQIAGLLGLGSITSFGGNIATSAINSSRAWKYARRAMEYQDQLNRQYVQDSYGLIRTGLERAGYNPLLALGSNANSAVYSGAGVNSDSDNGSQAVTSATDAVRLANETKIVNKQGKKLDAEIDKIDAETKDIENKPRNLIWNEIKDYIKNGKMSNVDSAVGRLRKTFGKKLDAYKTAFDDLNGDVNSAVKANKKVYQLKAVYDDYRNGKPFTYRPDLDLKGKLPPELAKYHKKR